MEGELSYLLLYIYVFVTFFFYSNSQGRILSLSWHPSGTHIAAGSIDCISVFDVKSGDCFSQFICDVGLVCQIHISDKLEFLLCSQLCLALTFLIFWDVHHEFQSFLGILILLWEEPWFFYGMQYFIYFREKGREKGRERENISQQPPAHPLRD